MNDDEISIGQLDDEELLSMGQSEIVTVSLEDCDRSIFVNLGLGSEGTPLRALALYHVQRTLLGLDVKWPGKDGSDQTACRLETCGKKIRAGDPVWWFDDKEPTPGKITKAPKDLYCSEPCMRTALEIARARGEFA